MCVPQIKVYCEVLFVFIPSASEFSLFFASRRGGRGGEGRRENLWERWKYHAHTFLSLLRISMAWKYKIRWFGCVILNLCQVFFFPLLPPPHISLFAHISFYYCEGDFEPLSIGIFFGCFYCCRLVEIPFLCFCRAFLCHRHSFPPPPHCLLCHVFLVSGSSTSSTLSFYLFCRGGWSCCPFSPSTHPMHHLNSSPRKKVPWTYLLCGSGLKFSGRQPRNENK